MVVNSTVERRLLGFWGRGIQRRLCKWRLVGMRSFALKGSTDRHGLDGWDEGSFGDVSGYAALRESRRNGDWFRGGFGKLVMEQRRDGMCVLVT